MTTEIAMMGLVVRDGSTVCVRQAEEQDVMALLRFLESLSPESLYYRFHGRPALTVARVRGLVGLDGSEAKDLPHLFERFYRGAAAKTRASGTGMGLWIARGLLAAEHGHIWAENRPDGAEFTIAIPALVTNVPRSVTTSHDTPGTHTPR
jgi:hypothetical protein